MKTIKTLVAAATLSLLALTNAHAGGFLADTFIRPFSPEAADAADRINHNLGNPVDHAIAAGANVIVPGSGAVIEGGYAIQRSGVLNGVGQAQQQQIPMGNFCLTQVGRFGPGPMNRIGSFCQAGTPWGVVPGTVGR